MSARRDLLEDIIVKAQLAYGMPAPDTIKLDGMVTVWDEVTAPIPDAQLMRMYQREMRTRSSQYPVAAVDLMRQWREFGSETPDVTFQQEEQERAHLRALPGGEQTAGPARRAFVALGERLRAGLGDVVCNCIAPDGQPAPAVLAPGSTVWQCAHGACAFVWKSDTVQYAPRGGKPGPLAEGLGEPRRDPQPIEPEVLEPPREPELRDAEVLALLADECGFDTDRDDALAFGRFIIGRVGVSGFNQLMAKALWPAFKAQQATAAANPTPPTTQHHDSSNGGEQGRRRREVVGG